MNIVLDILNGFLYILLTLLLFYFFRHFIFTMNRAYRSQELLYLAIEDGQLPTVTILVPAHNEEKVITDALDSLLRQDYPQNLFTIIPVNDRSTDRTREIIDDFAARYPGRILPFHRDTGKPGKAAALKDVSERITSEIVIVFDADYIPAAELLRNLVSPFLDPEVGAVMGRVVPINTAKNLLTRVLDLERSAGYQVDQQARMNMKLLPQYGGTVGGVRKSALDAIGGWDFAILAEDTDVTVKMYLQGWSVVYQNACECYEEVPENWDMRRNQIRRWARGHNQVMFAQFGRLMSYANISFLEKFDAILLLGIFLMGPVIFMAWGIAQIMYYTGFSKNSLLASHLMIFVAFSALGNFALFFEIGTAAYLDGYRKRIRLLPLGVAFFFVSLTTVTATLFRQIWEDQVVKKDLVWQKTARFRSPKQKGGNP
jgi:cellulose synthase/poly-beta-1,6-N-acetylglucosamine synthase-like glycosyltransferase